MHFLKRHFPFVLASILLLAAAGLNSWSPASSRETNLVAVAAVLLIAVVVGATYAVFLLVERRETRHAVSTALAAEPETPMPALPGRVGSVLERIPLLVTMHPEILAVALVGVWARGEGDDRSAVDLVVIAADPTALLATDDWYRVLDGPAELIRSSSFGALTERRLRRPDGLEISVGIGAPGWLSVDPMYPGTAAVLTQGAVAAYDPRHLLALATKAAANPSVPTETAGS